MREGGGENGEEIRGEEKGRREGGDKERRDG